jgi:hypothetical protein
VLKLRCCMQSAKTSTGDPIVSSQSGRRGNGLTTWEPFTQVILNVGSVQPPALISSNKSWFWCATKSQQVKNKKKSLVVRRQDSAGTISVWRRLHSIFHRQDRATWSEETLLKSAPILEFHECYGEKISRISHDP